MFPTLSSAFFPKNKGRQVQRARHKIVWHNPLPVSVGWTTKNSGDCLLTIS